MIPSAKLVAGVTEIVGRVMTSKHYTFGRNPQTRTVIRCRDGKFRRWSPIVNVPQIKG